MRNRGFLFPLGIAAGMAAAVLLARGPAYAQGFQVKNVSDHVLMVSHPDLGNQVVIRSAKGLLVFDAFWSENTARRFRAEIEKALHRDDFALVIDMADRLDFIGGHAAYPGAKIVGHANIRTKYENRKTVEEERQDLIEMWREKEGLSRGRLPKMDAASEQARTERDWMNKCKVMADELESGFSMILPGVVYADKMTLNMGDVAIRLRWFGETGNYRGLTMADLPGEKLAVISKSIIFPSHHLAPYVQPDFRILDVPRWIALFEDILEGDHAVDRIIISDDGEILSPDRLRGHLNYIRRLWNAVKTAEAEGLTLDQIHERLSLDKEFAFVKDMPVYKANGDRWVRPQHELHTRLFFLQHKNNASEVIREGGVEALPASLEKIRKAAAGYYYIDEMSVYGIGREWMRRGRVAEAIEVFKFDAEAFPRSTWIFTALGEAYAKSGDVDKAAASYKKALEIDPANGRAQGLLKQIEKKEPAPRPEFRSRS